MKVDEVMTRNPVFLKETDFMTHARQVMRDRNKRTVPVVDNKNRVVGILNEKEILNIFSTKSNVTVEGFSTAFPEIYPDMDIMQAARLMMESGLGRVPVLKSGNEKTLMGILSVVDIFRSLNVGKLPQRKASEMKVSEIMTKDVRTCSPKDSIAKVWLNMKESGFSGYPVVKDGQILGMVTRRNIINAGYARIEREDDNGTKLTMSPPVDKIMSAPPYTLSGDANLKEAIQAFMKLGVGRLSVVNDGKLVGIIDRSDIIKAFI